MLKIKLLGRNFAYFLASKLNLVNFNYYRIDGGLGSQIICFLIYSQAKKINKNSFCDTSFFYKNQSDKIFSSNTYRQWGLYNFGITLESLETTSKLRFWDKIKLKPNDKYFGIQFDNFMKNYDFELSKLIPDFRWEKTILMKYKIENYDYCVVHIRKGDFLKYASYLVNDLSYIKLLLSIKELIPIYVFIVSDEELEINLKTQIQETLINKKIIFEDSSPEIEIHGLMRNSKVLITSNSMFSLSAAILRPKNLLTITPKVFFGKDFDFYNRGINHLSEWNIL